MDKENIITLGVTKTEDNKVETSYAYFNNSTKVALDINGASSLLTSCANILVDAFPEQHQCDAEKMIIDRFLLMMKNRAEYLQRVDDIKK